MPIAVVTGAGSGLGRAIAVDLANRGFLVHATDLDAAAAARTAAEVGAGAAAAALDVRDEAACRAIAAEAATRNGSLDLWVNNAAALITGPPWEQDEEARRTMLDVNALGTMNGTVAALERMLPNDRGHIVNVISLGGLVAAPGKVAYSAAKQAALAFTLGTRFDLRRSGVKGIEISAVCPDGIWAPVSEERPEGSSAASSSSDHQRVAEGVAVEVGRLVERPQALLTLPRWRGSVLRIFDLFPRFALRALPFVMHSAQRRQGD
jgi:NAD(P)-dependent dehydrogenase (short-subunit alcohol dehydrogenase family)